MLNSGASSSGCNCIVTREWDWSSASCHSWLIVHRTSKTPSMAFESDKLLSPSFERIMQWMFCRELRQSDNALLSWTRQAHAVSNMSELGLFPHFFAAGSHNCATHQLSTHFATRYRWPEMSYRDCQCMAAMLPATVIIQYNWCASAPVAPLQQAQDYRLEMDSMHLYHVAPDDVGVHPIVLRIFCTTLDVAFRQRHLHDSRSWVTRCDYDAIG